MYLRRKLNGTSESGYARKKITAVLLQLFFKSQAGFTTNVEC
jgi:hypothetical protein